MKKLILISILVFLFGVTYGQKVKQGNTVGVHVITFQLNPDYTMEQAQDYLINTYIPLWEKHHPGIKSYFTKSVRGKNNGSYGWINIVESLETLRKYYGDDGKPTELEKSIQEKIRSDIDKFRSIFKDMKNEYNTWLVL